MSLGFMFKRQLRGCKHTRTASCKRLYIFDVHKTPASPAKRRLGLRCGPTSSSQLENTAWIHVWFMRNLWCVIHRTWVNRGSKYSSPVSRTAISTSFHFTCCKHTQWFVMFCQRPHTNKTDLQHTQTTSYSAIILSPKELSIKCTTHVSHTSLYVLYTAPSAHIETHFN